MRLAFVVPRYGTDIIGGAESQVRNYAEHLVLAGHQVEVLTTCARDHVTWRNELPAGDVTVNGVRVRRFRVSRHKDHGVMADLHARLDAGFPLDAEGERLWVENTGYSEGLLAGIAATADAVDALLFTPYLFASTVFGVRVRPERSLVIPCLHDEPYAHFPFIADALASAAGLVFNTSAEQRLGGRLLSDRLPPNRLVGSGFDALTVPADAQGWRRRRKIGGDLITYAGRREGGKNFPLLLRWTVLHSEALAPQTPVRLVAMGSGVIDAPPRALPWLLDLGIVDEAEKFDAMAASLAVAQLSVNESFSYLIAEGWLSAVPAIVHAACEVTREHCERSGGGLWVEDAEEFSAVLVRLQRDPELRARLARAGRTYILGEYGWPRVVSRLVAAVEELIQ